ncbi:hypothetical protein Tco_1189270 [Tanacetum coccineum]
MPILGSTFGDENLSDDVVMAIDIDNGRVKVVWEVIETRLVVEAARRFVTSSSLSMLSPNLAKDSSMVGGVDGLDDGGGVYEANLASSIGGMSRMNESTIVRYRFEMVSLPRTRLRSGRIRPLERARLQEL